MKAASSHYIGLFREPLYSDYSGRFSKAELWLFLR